MLRSTVMRLAVLALSLFTAGCGPDQRMKAEAQHILDLWPPPSRGLSSSLELVWHDGKEFVHGRLTNHSNHPITLNESKLPWNAQIDLHLEAITRRGTRLPQYGVEIGPESLDRFVAIAPGAHMEGEFESRYLNLPLDRKQDVLLVWIYSVGDQKGPRHVLSGTLFLPEADPPWGIRTGE
jgi:hypothetical protein